MIAGQADVPVQQVAAYGPRRVCIGGVALRVGAREAVAGRTDAAGTLSFVRLLEPQSRGLTLTTTPADLTGYKVRSDVLRTASGLVATRYRIARWRGYRAGIPGEAVYAVEPAHRVYRVGEGASAIWVQADAFAEAGDDVALLDRLSSSAAGPCDPLAAGDPPGTVPVAEAYQPDLIAGPTRACADGVALDLRSGETLRLGWRTVPLSRTWYLAGPAGSFRITIARSRDRRWPTGVLARLGYTLRHAGPGDAEILPPGGRADPRFGGYIHGDGTVPAALDDLFGRLAFAAARDRACGDA